MFTLRRSEKRSEEMPMIGCRLPSFWKKKKKKWQRNKKETVAKKGLRLNASFFCAYPIDGKAKHSGTSSHAVGIHRLPCINAFSVHRQETQKKKAFVGSTGLDEKREFTLEQFHVIASPPLMIICSKQTIFKANRRENYFLKFFIFLR